MRKFKDYLSEEVVPTAFVKNGSIGLDKQSVRDNINMVLKSISVCNYVTPYIALNKVAQTLAQFHITLPKRPFLEGPHGLEVYEVRQFGQKMGMTDQGEFVNETPVQGYLLFTYNIGFDSFMITAKILDKLELDKELDRLEQVMKEEVEINEGPLAGAIQAIASKFGKNGAKEYGTHVATHTAGETGDIAKHAGPKDTVKDYTKNVIKHVADTAVPGSVSAYHDIKKGEYKKGLNKLGSGLAQAAGSVVSPAAAATLSPTPANAGEDEIARQKRVAAGKPDGNVHESHKGKEKNPYAKCNISGKHKEKDEVNDFDPRRMLSPHNKLKARKESEKLKEEGQIEESKPINFTKARVRNVAKGNVEKSSPTYDPKKSLPSAEKTFDKWFPKKDVKKESLNEISRKTLGSYIKKASDSRSQATTDANYYLNMADRGKVSKGDIKTGGKALKTVIKRREGIIRATDKLTKEEVEPIIESNDEDCRHFCRGFEHGYTKKKKEKGGNRHYNNGHDWGSDAKMDHEDERYYNPKEASGHAYDAWKQYRAN